VDEHYPEAREGCIRHAAQVEPRGAVEHGQVADARGAREKSVEARHGRLDRLPANGPGDSPSRAAAPGHRHAARADGTLIVVRENESVGWRGRLVRGVR